MPYTATTAIAGYDGSVATTGGDGDAGSEIRKWNCDITCEALDATNVLSLGFEEVIAGLKGGSGSFEAIGACPVIGAVTTLTLKTKSSGGRTIAGAAIIEDVSYGAVVDGLQTYTATFTFKGTITVS